MSVLKKPGTIQRYVEGTKLALCVRAQTQKPKRERIKGFANTGRGLPEFLSTNQEEKITI
jgi:hypothetical protein